MKQFPDELGYRCSHCGAASCLHWHYLRPTVPVCSRRECNEAVAKR